MFIVNYLVGLGVIFILFSLLNLVVTGLLAGLVSLTGSPKGLLMLKAASLYVWASVSALWTRGFFMVNEGMGSTAHIVIPIIGASVLFFTSAGDMHHTQKVAEKAGQGDYPSDLDMPAYMKDDVSKYQGRVASTLRKYGGLLVWGNLILFALALFLPEVASNMVTVWFFGMVKWTISIPVIGLVLAIGGMLFAIVQAFRGLSLVAIGAVALFASKKN